MSFQERRVIGLSHAALAWAATPFAPKPVDAAEVEAAAAAVTAAAAAASAEVLASGGDEAAAAAAALAITSGTVGQMRGQSWPPNERRNMPIMTHLFTTHIDMLFWAENEI